MPTKAELISKLKEKGVRGKLSKMTKPQLQKLHREHSDTSSSRGNLELEPLPGERTNKPSVARKRSTYQEFVAQHLKENGGNMQAAAAAYREQQQGSGLAGDIGRKVGKAVTHGVVGVAKGVKDAVAEELHHKKEHKGGSMAVHAKHHSDRHMEAMEREMEDNASFDEAHDSAMESVGAGYDSDDDLDNYLEGGTYWADKDFTMSMEPELQGSGHWYDPTTWSSGTQQAVGTALQTAGMMGLMALGGPEAEAVMGAEGGLGAAETAGESALSKGESEALSKELGEGEYKATKEQFDEARQSLRRTQVPEQTGYEPSQDEAFDARRSLRNTIGEVRNVPELEPEPMPSGTDNPLAVTEKEATDSVAKAGSDNDSLFKKLTDPLFKKLEPASDEALEGTEEDSAPERIKKNVSKMKRLVNEGKHGAARKLREGLVDKYGVGVDVKAGEGWGKYLTRVGTKVMIPSLGVEAGEKLKTEGEQKESFTKIEDEGRIVTNALKKATEGLGTNQANIMQELQRERQRNLASEWQRARDRTYNPYLQ